MRNAHTLKIVSYRRLIKSGKYYIKMLRQAGFRFDTDLSYGSIFRQVEGFSISRYESENDL